MLQEILLVPVVGVPKGDASYFEPSISYTTLIATTVVNVLLNEKLTRFTLASMPPLC